MNRLAGKTALITGCNRGIGKAILERFAEEGADIVAGIRTANETTLRFFRKIEESCHVSIKVLKIDMAEEDSIKSAMKELISWKTSVDILVNNAGIAAGGFLLTSPMKTIKDVFQINYFSQIFLTQHVIKGMMRKKSGSIIFMSSVLGLDSIAGGTSYGASKAAISLLTKSLSKEVGQFGIRVNAIAPNLINTDMAMQMEEKSFSSMVTKTSLGRIGEAKEVAATAAFLASDDASYITGQIIRVDGGM